MKWRVTTTKSKKQWLAWKLRHRKHTLRLFDTWEVAFAYAICMCEIDRRFN